MSVPFVFPPQTMRSAEPLSSLLHTRFQGRVKRGRGGKAVSWPPEDQICQIQFFMSNDAPASIASGQAVFQSNHVGSSSAQGRDLDATLDVPPGFHGGVAKRARINIAMEEAVSAEMAWCCPTKFILDPDWLVADGEDSKDTEVQTQRELRVLEAFFPRLTSIPDSPTEPMELVKCIDDKLVPVIPLVTIEEEYGHPQDAEQEQYSSDMVATGHGKVINDQKPQHSSSGSPAEPNILGKPWQEPTMDTKVAAAAAAAAACLAVNKIGVNGLVDQDLLLEILRNPALLKGLTQLNASCNDSTGTMSHNENGLHGQATMSAHSISECAEALNKGFHGASMNVGFPSPVSVLQDWSPELLPITLSKTPSNLRINGDPPGKTKTSCPSLPISQLHSAYPSSNNVARTEPALATSQEVHAFGEESRLGMTVSAQATSLVQVDRSRGMAALLAPFPSQNTGSYAASRMKPSQVVMHDHVLSRSACVDARTRGLQYETTAVGHTSKKTSRLCVYYNTPRGCRNGGSCVFVHQLVSRGSNRTNQ